MEIKNGFLGLVLCSVGITACSASNAGELDFDVSARLRTQQINDEARGDATAHTLKLRLGAGYRLNDQFESFLQLDHVHAFNEDDFNYITVTRATSPVQDVPGTELNKAWLKYNSESDWSLKLGRQSIAFDNDRHVSSVEFWQNDQVYDALTFDYGDPGQWHVSYSYVAKVHRIFGRDAKTILPQEDIRFDTNPNRPFLELGINDHNTHLLNVNYQVNQYLGLTGYLYSIDNETTSQFSSQTTGVRIDGEVKPSTVKYSYTAEYAYQQTANSSVWDFAGSYAFLELGAQYRSHEILFSYERLAQDNGFAFATSLGDNHKFLGWADIFSSYLNTDGIRDSYITYRGRKAKLRWRVIAHQFVSDSTGRVAGNEFDFELGYRFNRKWEATLIASAYKAKDGIDGLAASQSDLSTWTLSINYNL